MENSYKELLNSDLERDALNEINQMLEEELSKKPSERNYDKIEEFTKAYSELSDEEDFIHEAAERGIRQLTEQNEKHHRIYMTRNLRLWLTAGVAAAVMLIANAVSVAAFHQNVFSVVVNYTKNGFSIGYPETEKIELPTSQDDPYGIIAECEKYGLHVESPTYIPEGFVPVEVKKHENSSCKEVSIRFENGENRLLFKYTELYDFNFKTNIPSDHFNLEEIQVNGKPAITSKEDGQYNLIYYDGNMEYLMYSNSLPYEECEKIVASIKK